MASTGLVALSEVRRTGWDSYCIVLMDLHMPELDGFETTKALRALELEQLGGRRVPIVAVTASLCDDTELQRCYRCGMDLVLRKPLDVARLRAVMESFSCFDR